MESPRWTQHARLEVRVQLGTRPEFDSATSADADQDTPGYAYFPNRMGTSLEDPRDIALRAAVYRCLGERAPDGIRPTPRGEAPEPLSA